MPDPYGLISVLRSEASFISGEVLARKASISRSAVWKQIKALRAYGYGIESRHGSGYRFISQTDLPLPWELERILQTSFVGKRVVYHEILDSTQDKAIAFANRDDSNGQVIIAQKQKSGRGRQKKKWLSPKGGIWLSVILKPRLPTAKITLLPFVTALAVYDSIKASGLDAELKWPNDVLISGKKVAGILIDISAEADHVNYAVIGVGINANFDSGSLSKVLDGTKVTTLRQELGHNIDRLALTRSLLENLEHYYLELEHFGTDPILEKWKIRSKMMGHKVEVTQESRVFQGVVKDINSDGSLLIQTDHGDIDIVSADVNICY